MEAILSIFVIAIVTTVIWCIVNYSSNNSYLILNHNISKYYK